MSSYGDWMRHWQLSGLAKSMKALVAQAAASAQTATTAAGEVANAATDAATASAAATAAAASEGNAATSAQNALDSANAAAASAAIATKGVASNTLTAQGLALAAAIGATANATFNVGTTFGSLALQVTAANQTAGVQNYEIEFYDGSAAGALLYRASGITDQNFTDNACFFIPPLASGNIYVLVTNIDANAMTLNLSIKLLAIQ